MDVACFVVKARSDTGFFTKRHRLWQLFDQARPSRCCTPARVRRLDKFSPKHADFLDFFRARPDRLRSIKPIPIVPARLELARLGERDDFAGARSSMASFARCSILAGMGKEPRATLLVALNQISSDLQQKINVSAWGRINDVRCCEEVHLASLGWI